MRKPSKLVCITEARRKRETDAESSIPIRGEAIGTLHCERSSNRIDFFLTPLFGTRQAKAERDHGFVAAADGRHKRLHIRHRARARRAGQRGQWHHYVPHRGHSRLCPGYCQLGWSPDRGTTCRQGTSLARSLSIHPMARRSTLVHLELPFRLPAPRKPKQLPSPKQSTLSNR